jgi:hypothetical protein
MPNPILKPLQLIEGSKLNEWFHQGLGWARHEPINTFTQITAYQKLVLGEKVFYQVEIEEHPIGPPSKPPPDAAEVIGSPPNPNQG